MLSETSTKDSSFLATAPLLPLFFKLSIPTITAQMINMLYNIVDRMFIGRIPEVGALALTGVGVCLSIILIITSFSSLLGFGGAPLVSIYLGKGEKPSAEQVLGNCFSTLVIASVVLTAVTLVFSEELLLLFGASADTIGYAKEYLNIYAIGTLFVQLSMGLNYFISAQGFARVSMVTILIGAVVNIALDPLFIFVLDMGVGGAALATIISQGLSALFVVGFLLSRHSDLKIKLRYMRPKLKVVMSCVSLGFSPFAMRVTESLCIISFNYSLLKYGGDIAVGAMTICNSAMQLIVLPLHGLAQGAQPISGYNLGAGNLDRVRQTFKILVVTCLAFSVAMWLSIMVVPQAFIFMFTDDPALAQYTRTALRVYMAGTLVTGIHVACQMSFLAIGCAKESAIGAFFRKFAVLIPLIFILPNFFADEDKDMAVFLAEPFTDITATLFTAILFAYKYKQMLGQKK